jgi:hypothetical protein
VISTDRFSMALAAALTGKQMAMVNSTHFIRTFLS